METPVVEEENEVTINDPKAVLDALERAKADAKKYRELSESMEATNKSLEEKIAALNGDERLTKLKAQIIELSAKEKLSKQGIKDADRIFGLLDADALDLDEAGAVTGLDENLEGLKKKLPELFDTKKRVGGGADAFEKEPVKQNLTTTEAQVARLRSH